MKYRNQLRHNYIQVRRKGTQERTFGGDQNFFAGAPPDSLEERKRALGCGFIAFSDLLLYMGSSDRRYCLYETQDYVNQFTRRGELEQEVYCHYFDEICDLLGGLSGRSKVSGISGFRLQMRFNHIARQQGWQLRARWGLSGARMKGRLQKMLAQDIPVILCIPIKLFSSRRRAEGEDGLTLYQRSGEAYRRAAVTNAHYVVVTGIISEEGGEYLEISSWGKKYFVQWNEYERLIQKRFLGTILGNILYIREISHR